MDSLDRIAVALEMEQKQRQLDKLVNEQRKLIAETLLLCQAYLDSIEGNYER